MPIDSYVDVLIRNLPLLERIEELDRARKSAMEQLGLKDGAGLRRALVLQWLVRLYAQRVGEARILREVKEIVGAED